MGSLNSVTFCNQQIAIPRDPTKSTFEDDVTRATDYRFMLQFVLALLAAAQVFFLSRNDTALEILALRQQLILLKRKRPRPRLNPLDRLFWIALRHIGSRWAEVLVAVKPEIVVPWHRIGFRLFCKWQSRAGAGRPKTTAEIRALIRRVAEENPTGGAPRIHGELQKLGFVVSERTVARYLQRIRRRGDPHKRWLTFLTSHRDVIAAFDFFLASTEMTGCTAGELQS